MKKLITTTLFTVCAAIGVTLLKEKQTSPHFNFSALQRIVMKEGKETISLNIENGRWTGTYSNEDTQNPTFFLTSYKFNAVLEAFSHLEPLRDLGFATPEKLESYRFTHTNDIIQMTSSSGEKFLLKLGRKAYGRSEQYVLYQDHIWLISREHFQAIRSSYKKHQEEHVIAGHIKTMTIHNHKFSKENMLWVDQEQKTTNLKPFLSWHIHHIQPEAPQPPPQQTLAQITAHNMDGTSQTLHLYKSTDPSLLWIKSSNGYWVSADISPYRDFETQKNNPAHKDTTL